MAAGLALLGAASSAAAVDTFTFEGRGFGHGIGMSQHGAQGAAEAGWDAGRILAHYYRGTALSPQPPREVRVQLRPSSVSVALDGSGLTWSSKGGGSEIALPRRIVARATPSGVELSEPGGAPLATGATVAVATASGEVALDGRRYRGSMVLHRTGGGRVRVVNHLDLEAYLYGVVPREVPASWHEQALRAQAIAARSYAIGQLRADRDFDVHPDTRSQVYGGREAEHPRTTAAVDATRRVAVTHGGEVATTFFHSTSGGHTESVENVWSSTPRPYLVGVPDPFDAGSPYHRWQEPPTFAAAELAERLGLTSPVTAVQVLARGVSPRVRSVRVTSSDGSETTLSGTAVRSRLGLRDTWFSINEDPPAPGAGAVRAPSPSQSQPVRYIVYAASLTSASRARGLRRQLLGFGKDVVILRRSVRGARRHLLVTGHFRQLANARSERDDLRRRGYRSARVGSALAGSASGYVVSVGWRRSRAAGRSLRRRLAADGVTARLVVRPRNGRRGFLVVTRRYPKLAAARSARDDLRARGYRSAMVGPARA